MHTETGTCRHCGQIRVVEVEDGRAFLPADLDAIASQECDCSGAEEERRIDTAIQAAKEAIPKLLEQEPTAAGLLLAGVDGVARGYLKKVSVNIDGMITCSMWQGKERRVIVERRETTVEQAE